MPLPLVKLPSLDALRGFVAVGRRMSITLAAEDLCLTQSAVSRQVHALEEALGVKLLVRGHRSISLTAEGARLFALADPMLQQLQELYGSMTGEAEAAPVTLTASIGVSGLWVLPRIGRLQALHPHIDLRVAATDKVLDLRAENIDLAIRYGPDATAPPGATRLFREAIVPVAHPSLGLKHARAAEAIPQHVLLEFDHPQRPWLGWTARLAALELAQLRPKAMLRFNQYDQVIHAALAGQGIALGRRALVQPMLDDGRLDALAWGEAGDDGGYSYWLIAAAERPRRAVAAVVEWILAEAAATAR